jgi:hypothetical protein
MVRLVFRPYTQLRRSICTSESLRSSIRISPDFNLTRHSSPSFGSQHIYSTYSQQTRLIGNGGIAGLTPHPSDRKRPFAFTAPSGLVNPMTRIHVRLLGPCFKTGRSLRRPTRKGMADRNRRVACCTSRPCACRVRSQDTGSWSRSTNFIPGLWSGPNSSNRHTRWRYAREPSRLPATGHC